MEYNVFSYTNNSKSNVVLVIEPWILIYDIPSKSTIKFYYSSSSKLVEISGFKDNYLNVYFDFYRIKVELDEVDITNLYPLDKL
ncbi:hypothetical protein F981_01748 [Acinetobacter guillouiae CIP 63.46]|nr:hypothetical protein F981_01748 [Acinetobacter guillouiae CIP 63.46]